MNDALESRTICWVIGTGLAVALCAGCGDVKAPATDAATDATASSDAAHDAEAPTDSRTDGPDVPDGNPTIRTGQQVTCARDDEELRCWGAGSGGTLGYGNTSSIGDNELASEGGVVDVGGDVGDFSLAGGHVCAVTEGSVRCWGENESGQLGYGNVVTIGDDETPATAGTVNIGFTVEKVAVGLEHSCALSTDGAVRCWGAASEGRLGYGNVDDIGDDEAPTTVGDVSLGGGLVRDIIACSSHSCAIFQGGQVQCWGANGIGQLGYGNVDNIGDDELPTTFGALSLGGPALQLTCGDHHTCALIEGGAVRCWGDGFFGMLGYGNTETIGDDEQPMSAGTVSLGGAAVQITAGGLHTCALLDGGTVRCWGYAADGQLGYGNTSNIGDDELPSSVAPVNVGGTVTEIDAGRFHTCARLATGAIRCWGQGIGGALGYGDSFDIGDNEPPASVGDVPYR